MKKKFDACAKPDHNASASEPVSDVDQPSDVTGSKRKRSAASTPKRKRPYVEISPLTGLPVVHSASGIPITSEMVRESEDD